MNDMPDINEDYDEICFLNEKHIISKKKNKEYLNQAKKLESTWSKKQLIEFLKTASKIMDTEPYPTNYNLLGQFVKINENGNAVPICNDDIIKQDKIDIIAPTKRLIDLD